VNARPVKIFPGVNRGSHILRLDRHKDIAALPKELFRASGRLEPHLSGGGIGFLAYPGHRSRGLQG